MDGGDRKYLEAGEKCREVWCLRVRKQKVGSRLIHLQPAEHLLSACLLVFTAEVVLAPAYVHAMTG